MTANKQDQNPLSLAHPADSALLQQERTLALLKDASLFAESIVDTVREPLLILGPDLKIVRANRSFYKTFRLKPEETVGFFLFKLNGGQWDIPILQRLFSEIQKNHTSFDNFEMEHEFTVVGKRSMLLNARPIISSTGETQLILLAMEDITDHKRVEESLRELSLKDELTNLYNRRGFLTLAEDRLKLVRRSKTGLWLFFADVDGLKNINDTFGHQEGDRALAEIAHVLKKDFRDSDIIARLSGDEFIILITTTLAADDCESIVLGRVEKSLNDLDLQGARAYKLKLSMGGCHFEGSDQWTVDGMMAKADEKLYELKKQRQVQLESDKQAGEHPGDYSKDE